MRNVTLSADETLIERARQRAHQEKTTLNTEFRRWLERYATADDPARRLRRLLSATTYARAGRTFTREEMNARR